MKDNVSLTVGDVKVFREPDGKTTISTLDKGWECVVLTAEQVKTMREALAMMDMIVEHSNPKRSTDG